jgi:hypothetical protein
VIVYLSLETFALVFHSFISLNLLSFEKAWFTLSPHHPQQITTNTSMAPRSARSATSTNEFDSVVAVLAGGTCRVRQALQNVRRASMALRSGRFHLAQDCDRSEALQILNLTEKQAVASPEANSKGMSMSIFV